MKPVFDKNGLATEPGDIRCFYYDPETGEYTGWSDEYINTGVSMPGHSTDIAPSDEVAGQVAVYKNGAWSQEEDHRGEIVYSTTDRMPSTIDYIGPVDDGYTTTVPSSPYDKWDGDKWVTDANAEHAAEVEVAEQQKAALLVKAQERINLWQTELQLGIISDEEKSNLITWINYIKTLKAVDVSTAPDITWPILPEE